MKHIFALIFSLISATLFAQTSPTQSPKSFIERSGKLYRIASLYPGVNVNDASSDQTGMSALLADTSIHNIYFPPGRYTVPSSITNTVSNRTFYFDAGAIIVGVFHVAAGTGTNNIVKNVTVIGNPIVTNRFGMYFCQNIKVDGVTLYDTSGVRGVHIYTGSKDVYIGTIHVWDADSLFAVGIDHDSTGRQYEPTNINIGEITIDDCRRSGVRLADVNSSKIGNVIIRTFDSTDAFLAYSCNDLVVDRLEINGRGCIAPVSTGASGLRIELDTNSHIKQAFIDCDTATMSAVSIVNSTAFPGTTLGSLYLRSSDTVGSKWGLQLSTTKNVWVSKVRATRFANAIRLVNATSTTILQMQADSSRIGFNTGGTNDTLTMLTADFVGNSADNGGTSPQSFSNIRGLLTNPNATKDSIRVLGLGVISDPVHDTIKPSAGLGGGFSIITNSNVGYRGMGLYWKTVLSSVERTLAAIKPANYTAADSGQVDLNFYIRDGQTDSVLTKVFGLRHDGYIQVGSDSGTAYILPKTRGSAGQVIKMGTGQNTAWANDSGGTGGSGDAVTVDTTLASGGTFDPSAPHFRADSGLSLNRIGATDSLLLFLKTGGILKGHFDTTAFGYVFDTVIAKSAVFTPRVMSRGTASTDTVYIGGNQNPSVAIISGTTGKIHFIEDGVLQWIMSGDSLNGTADSGVITGLRLLKVGATTLITDGTITTSTGYFNELRPTDGSALPIFGTDSSYYVSTASGDCIFSIRENGDTTFISSCDNSTLSINQPSLLAIDSAGVASLYIDTNGFHMFRFPRTKPTNGQVLSYVDVAGDIDTGAWITPSGGGTATRLGADSSAAQNTPLALDDTTVFLDGVGMKVNFENTGDTSTIWYDADTAGTLASRQFAQDIAGDSAALRTLIVDTTLGVHTLRNSSRIKEHPNGSIVFEIGLNAAGDTVKPTIGTGGVATTMYANNSVTEIKTDSTNRHYHFSSFSTDTLRSNKSTPLPMYVQDSISQFGKWYLDSIALGAHAWYMGRTIGTSGQMLTYFPQSGTDSVGWTTPFTASDAATLIEDSLDEYEDSGTVALRIEDSLDEYSTTTAMIAIIADSTADIDSNNLVDVGTSLPEDVAPFTSAELAAKLSNELGTGSAIFLTALQDSSRDAAGDSANAYAGNGRKKNIDLDIVHVGHFAGDLDSALVTDQSWTLTTPGTNGDAGTLTALYLLACSTSTAQDSLRFFLSGMVDEDATIESLVVIYKTSSATDIQFDSLRLLGDSVSATLSTVGATPDTLLKTTTDLQATSDTRVAFELTQTSGKIYRGGMLTLWILLTSDASTGANESARIRRAWVVTRLRK